MAIGMHNLTSSKGSRERKKRVGRGLGSTGTYSGRGGKGQTARSGVSGLRRLGMKRTILAQPKMRGFKSLEDKPAVVNVAALTVHFDGKTPITLMALKKAGVVRMSARRVKILGSGEVTVALTIKGCDISEGAKAKILAAGGKIV